MLVVFENHQPSNILGANTNGRKVLRFLAEIRGVSIDPVRMS